MSVEANARLIVGTTLDNINIDEDEMNELEECEGYAAHGSAFTGEQWFFGYKINVMDILLPDFLEQYEKLRLQVAEELGCSVDVISLQNDVYWW